MWQVSALRAFGTNVQRQEQTRETRETTTKSDTSFSVVHVVPIVPMQSLSQHSAKILVRRGIIWTIGKNDDGLYYVVLLIDGNFVSGSRCYIFTAKTLPIFIIQYPH